ncbi:MAG: class I SAM-dependent methyltransferase [Deltaproteobacteria bacterium]|nr:class I SAM-dependent methyltransferase [Deltaproteobacteria bacterium]
MSEPHSAEHLNDTRDSWWNHDFLALLAKRTGLDRALRVLDVGAGQGHFGRALAMHLPDGFALDGVDPEPAWVAQATEQGRAWLAQTGRKGTMNYTQGTAESLPFAAHSFDAVVCQTVLMHLRDPAVALREMQRVLVPGGLVLVAEPNNLGMLQRLAVSTLRDAPARLGQQAEDFARLFLGKRALGEGDQMLGARLPELLAGLSELQYCCTDRPFVMAPPYDTPAQRAEIAQLRDRVGRGVAGYRREQAQRYWLAGGGTGEGFEAMYERLLASDREELAAIEAGTHSELTAVVLLVGSGRTAG